MLVAGTVGLYARTVHFEFTNFDDNAYVYENHHVMGGLSGENFVWAFTTDFAANWHPLIWLSLMLDVSVFGAKPGLMHLENTLLHAANTALLFAVLLRMTGARWPSAWVAAMFAWHPLHVESVAWITERKDTLSTLFWLLCMGMYVRYVQTRSRRDYLLAIAMLVLGLLCKAMLVTLPFVLLLMDFWPLARTERFWKRVGEKGWMFAAIVACAIATFAAQSAGHSVVPIRSFPLSVRLANAATACAIYLRQMAWPTHLAIFYPITIVNADGKILLWPVAISAAVLCAITILAIVFRRRQPWLLIGWLWYLGTLVPVIGIVQVGSQAHADRYTYVPSIGILIALAWIVGSIVKRSPGLRWGVGALAVVSLVSAGAVAWRQIGYWHDSITLMEHAIRVVPDNSTAYGALGEALDSRGDHAGAARAYHDALRINPRDAVALYDLAVQALVKHDDENAYTLLRQALWADPTYGPVYNNYGNLLMRRGRVEDAIAVYRAGIKRDPDSAQLRHNLALALAGQGKLDEAIALWKSALAIDPNYADARESLGNALILSGQSQQGIAELRQAIRIHPDSVSALKTLAWTLATDSDPLYQNGPEAEQLASRAVQLSKGTDPVALDTLAAAQAREGHFDAAIQTADHAADLADQQHKADLAAAIRKRVGVYQNHQAFTSGE